MDDLIRHAVAEPPLDLPRLGAAEQLRLARVEAHEPSSELVALGVAEADAVAFWAAWSFVTMPPVPRAPSPPARRSISGVIASTRSIRCASGSWRGSPV